MLREVLNELERIEERVRPPADALSEIERISRDTSAAPRRQVLYPWNAPACMRHERIDASTPQSALDGVRADSMGDITAVIKWDGRWCVVDPDVRPLASPASADRAASRRYVDAAVASLRGEPFAGAIQAALVGLCERACPTAAEISACVAALRHWERRRPAARDLSAPVLDRLRGEALANLRCELGYAPAWDPGLLFSAYERARGAR
jgi:hypothetical protein